MKLFSRFNGEGKDALVILHGLLGSSANWRSLAKRFGQHRVVYSLDLRNHGQSPWSENMDYAVMADDVLELIDSLDHQRICLLGHSMGGKVAMELALSSPESVDSIIIADIAPIAYHHDFDHFIEPMLALDLSTISRRSQADKLLSRDIPDPAIRAFLLHNLDYDKAEDCWSWRPNLEVLLDSMPKIIDFDVPFPGVCTRPALFIHGENSDYLLPEHRQTIRFHFPRVSFNEIKHAGHWLHAEQPKAFVQACEAFLSA